MWGEFPAHAAPSHDTCLVVSGRHMSSPLDLPSLIIVGMPLPEIAAVEKASGPRERFGQPPVSVSRKANARAPRRDR
jgi:hypothetical protein